MPPSRIKLRGIRPTLMRHSFVVRWGAAVAMSVLLTGCVEYAFASHQLEQRLLEQAADTHVTEAYELEEALAEAPTPLALQRTLDDEVTDLVATGLLYVAVFDTDGTLLSAAGESGEPYGSAAVDGVVESLQPEFGAERDAGESDQAHRFEFLLPVRTADGVLVMEIDQRADIIEGVLGDLQTRKALGLLLVAVFTVPLSYLLGGRSLRRRQSKADQLADTDALTGVAGRRPFQPLLQATLADPDVPSVALALIDVDRFKRLNDHLGHSYGDRVLVALGESFEALRSYDSAFRLGGDEFAVVLPHADDEQAVDVLERVRACLETRVPGVTVSCGVTSVRPEEQVSLQELWERCDSALYEAKRLGRARTVSFTAIASGITATADKLDAVAALLEDDRGLAVAFQPIWDLRRGRIVGHEALLRLPHDQPLDGPAEAFELGHRLGVAAELDASARRAVLRAVGVRRWEGLLFIHVHPDALRGLDVDSLVAEVSAAGLSHEDVVLEVTEQADLDNPENIRTLKRAHALGFRLALDDMGQGNAGLRALTHVRFDVIKLDRQVIARLGVDPASDATVAAATTFVLRTGGWVIAGGIEDLQKLDAIVAVTDRRATTVPIIAGQGYLLGRPAPAAGDRLATLCAQRLGRRRHRRRDPHYRRSRCH